ncbi:MAG: NADP-dependent oxidoreductase [Mycobacteriales bacterium]
MPQSREVQLVARPVGAPTEETFRLATTEVPDPAEGEVLVRNRWMSVDPYMRGRMSDRKSYVAPFQVGAALEGGAVGEVVASRSDTHQVGDTVLHMQGWRDYAVGPARSFRRVDASEVPASSYLGVLGMPGLTAWAGLVKVAAMQPGETVFVSGAAGAVGSLVGQLATLRGGTAIGSAGSPEKVAWLEEIGFAVAFDYHDGVLEQLRAAAPDGIDVYFDNVGGEHLEAAIDVLKVHGRVAVCGMISAYNSTEPPPGPRNIMQVVGKRLRLEGFLATDQAPHQAEFLAEVTPLLRDGRLVARETVVEGLENAPSAFLGLLSGANTGKMLVRL